MTRPARLDSKTATEQVTLWLSNILGVAHQVRTTLDDLHGPLDLHTVTVEVTRMIEDDPAMWHPPVSEDDLARVKWLQVAQVLAISSHGFTDPTLTDP